MKTSKIIRDVDLNQEQKKQIRQTHATNTSFLEQLHQKNISNDQVILVI